MELNTAPTSGGGEEATPESSETGRRRRMIGRVVSDKMDKTVVVEVTRTVKHGRYHKFVTRRKKYHAHDEANECKVDDTVVIQESRPLSKTKHWIVIERRTA